MEFSTLDVPGSRDNFETRATGEATGRLGALENVSAKAQG